MNNATNNTNATNEVGFRVGQIVKLLGGWRYGYRIIPCVVVHVTQKGITSVRRYEDQVPIGTKFNPSGWALGNEKYARRIVVLDKGETPDGIIAENKAAKDAEAAKREAEAQARRDAIAAWWEATGQHIWEARIKVNLPILGCDVFVLQYTTRYGDQRAVFMSHTAKRNPFTEKDEVNLTSCGMDKRTDYMSAYSASTATGATFEEAMYSMLA
jgi:hypothetical protein